MLNLLMVPVAIPLKYNNSMLPKLLIRLYGNEVPFGSIVSINWLLCIPLTPLCGVLTQSWEHLDAIRLGSLFTGFGTVILVAHVSLTTVCIWEIVITIGECLFAARMYALAAELAPRGMEATLVVGCEDYE